MSSSTIHPLKREDLFDLSVVFYGVNFFFNWFLFFFSALTPLEEGQEDGDLCGM